MGRKVPEEFARAVGRSRSWEPDPTTNGLGFTLQVFDGTLHALKGVNAAGGHTLMLAHSEQRLPTPEETMDAWQRLGPGADCHVVVLLAEAPRGAR